MKDADVRSNDDEINDKTISAQADLQYVRFDLFETADNQPESD